MGADLIVKLFEAGQAEIFSLPDFQAFVVLAVLSLLTAKVVEILTLILAEGLLSRLGVEVDRDIFERLHEPIYVSVALGGLYISTIPLDLPMWIDSIIHSTLITLTVILWARALKQIGDIVADESFNTPMDREFAPIFQNVWVAAILIVTGIIILKVWAINLTPLIASAGIISVTVGFAARGTIANFIGGISLYSDNTYKVGDFVELDSGEEGTVIDIGIRSTSLRTRDGNRITVPNSHMNSTIINNESAPQKRSRFSATVGVEYESEPEDVIEVLESAAKDADLVLDQPSPDARLVDFGSSSLDFEVLCWTDRPRNVPQAEHNVNMEIFNALRENGIGIPFPQRDLNVRNRKQGVMGRTGVSEAADESVDDGDSSTGDPSETKEE